MNSDTGEMRALDLSQFGKAPTLDEAYRGLKAQEDKLREEGFNSFFNVGQILLINGCWFKVNNFVEENSFMNLKLIPKKEALKILAEQTV